MASNRCARATSPHAAIEALGEDSHKVADDALVPPALIADLLSRPASGSPLVQAAPTGPCTWSSLVREHALPAG